MMERKILFAATVLELRHSLDRWIDAQNKCSIRDERPNDEHFRAAAETASRRGCFLVCGETRLTRLL